MQLGRRNALLAIGVGGLIAGALDITQAIILFGKEVPLVIAAGVLGKGALRGGGAGTYALGLFLHFFIATSVATIYYVASRRLKIFGGTLDCVRFVLRRGGRSSDGAYRVTIIRASRRGSVQTSRRASGNHRPQRRDRVADLFQCSPVHSPELVKHRTASHKMLQQRSSW